MRLLTSHARIAASVPKKAKQAAHELSSSFKEHIAALLQHLEVPGGYVQLDSQVMHGAGELSRLW